MFDGVGEIKTVTRTELTDLKDLADYIPETTEGNIQEDSASNAVPYNVPDSQQLRKLVKDALYFIR